jgi:Cof subfamily protein (haloacid dehalogenase superfamily)
MIKVIALDIDGTLFNAHEDIMPLTRQMLMEAHKQGITLILASGRSIHGLKSLVSRLDFPLENTMLIGYNGASLIDASTHEILFQSIINQDLAVSVLNSTRNHPVTVMIPVDDELWVEDLQHPLVQFEAQTENLRLRFNKDLSQLELNPIKIMITSDKDNLKEYFDQLPEDLHNQAIFARSGDVYIDVTNLGCDKGSALQRYCELKGISRNEVIAFGDNYNDLSMIEYAGIGIAMGNAVEDLKKVANEVTLTNNEDGIGVWLQKHLGEETGE